MNVALLTKGKLNHCVCFIATVRGHSHKNRTVLLLLCQLDRNVFCVMTEE